MFDLETHKWAIVEPSDASAPTPKPRAGHSASFHGTSMFILGGKDDENCKLGDFWKFDVTTRAWTNLETATG